MELLEIPLVGDTKESQLPTPEEYTYWKDRQNRTFYVDYEIDECYSLVELAKIIIQMNIEEKDVRKEDLKPIRLFIHSYGGDLEQANFFCDLVQAEFLLSLSLWVWLCRQVFLFSYLDIRDMHLSILS